MGAHLATLTALGSVTQEEIVGKEAASPSDYFFFHIMVFQPSTVYTNIYDATFGAIVRALVKDVPNVLRDISLLIHLVHITRHFIKTSISCTSHVSMFFDLPAVICHCSSNE